MVIYDYDLSEYNIWHMMIDKHEQGKGYGKAALKECFAYIAQKPFGNSSRVVLTCSEENLPALSLYKGLGFLPTGNRAEDEIELAYPVSYTHLGNTMDFAELHRLASAILDLYDRLTNESEGRRMFTWNFGMRGGDL